MASPKGQGDTLTIQAVEFQRLQSQLIELRTANYQLKEEQQKLASGIAVYVFICTYIHRISPTLCVCGTPCTWHMGDMNHV
jgi:hypothetical protein